MRDGYGRRQSHASTAAAGSASVPIEVVKVGDDDRNRKCYGEYAGDDAHSAYQLAPDTHWRDVTVPNRCHGNDRPPECAGNRRQLFTQTNEKNNSVCVNKLNNSIFLIIITVTKCSCYIGVGNAFTIHDKITENR